MQWKRLWILSHLVRPIQINIYTTIQHDLLQLFKMASELLTWPLQQFHMFSATIQHGLCIYSARPLQPFTMDSETTQYYPHNYSTWPLQLFGMASTSFNFSMASAPIKYGFCNYSARPQQQFRMGSASFSLASAML